MSTDLVALTDDEIGAICGSTLRTRGSSTAHSSQRSTAYLYGVMRLARVVDPKPGGVRYVVLDEARDGT